MACSKGGRGRTSRFSGERNTGFLALEDTWTVVTGGYWVSCCLKDTAAGGRTFSSSFVGRFPFFGFKMLSPGVGHFVVSKTSLERRSGVEVC